ncbi:hypothetical protein E5225_00185 [Cellulomonas shaoxiangyii]|uniref:Uncharacterized protein n=1 Tax=Cellulomonas shaoxiangyii TaxID=2566013 RepID=A0A4V1CM99_9CELL|nr:hypothetical protein E5225_00185 [Cellulomonas shaoxiangyii]
MHREPAGVLLGVLAERHRDRADERVVLTARVVGDVGRQLLREGLGTPLLDLVVVGRGQLDGELVGHDRAVAADDRRTVVQLTPQRVRELDRLDLAAEGAREGVVHDALHAVLEFVEESHAHLLPPVVRAGRPGQEARPRARGSPGGCRDGPSRC